MKMANITGLLCAKEHHNILSCYLKEAAVLGNVPKLRHLNSRLQTAGKNDDVHLIKY